ncbi:hypothetical protein HID58_015283, partial [Brassica napus]
CPPYICYLSIGGRLYLSSRKERWNRQPPQKNAPPDAFSLTAVTAGVDEWKEPSDEALAGGRGMFCVVPLGKTLFQTASQSINSAVKIIDMKLQKWQNPMHNPSSSVVDSNGDSGRSVTKLLQMDQGKRRRRSFSEQKGFPPAAAAAAACLTYHHLQSLDFFSQFLRQSCTR